MYSPTNRESSAGNMREREREEGEEYPKMLQKAKANIKWNENENENKRMNVGSKFELSHIHCRKLILTISTTHNFA